VDRPPPAVEAAYTAWAISSSDSGFSSDERSPGSSPSARARTARRTIFALRLRKRGHEEDPDRIALPHAERGECLRELEPEIGDELGPEAFGVRHREPVQLRVTAAVEPVQQPA